jgi:hypothetical protein
LVPRRLRDAYERARRLKAPLRLFFPGGANGLRFVIYSALAAHGACFLVFAFTVGPDIVHESGMRSPATILIWTTIWSFLFIAFTAELAFLLSCELRHEIASRACAAIAIVALALGPFLWLVIEYPEKRAYPYKGYWASPVTVALSAITVPTRPEERQLFVGGPSGYDIREARDALTRRSQEWKGPPGDRPQGDPVERTRHELLERSVEPETIDAACAEVAVIAPTIPSEPGAITDDAVQAIVDKARDRLVSALKVRGTPVHEVSTYVYAALVVVLAFVVKRRSAKFSRVG